MLRRLVEQMGVNNWKALSSQMGTNRTEEECQARWIKIQHHTRGPWTPEEDARMIEWVANMGGAGKIKWSSVAELLPRRVGKQCRERWINHLDPSVKKGDWTSAEDDIIFEMQKQRGNKWSEIARLVPGRSENAVKNRWNSSARRRWYEIRSMEDPGTPRGSKSNTPRTSSSNNSASSTSSTSSSTKTKTNNKTSGSSSKLKRKTTSHQRQQQQSGRGGSATTSFTNNNRVAQPPLAPSSNNKRPILAQPPPNPQAFAAFMAQQAAFQASMMATQQKKGGNQGVPKMRPFMPMMPPLLMQQMMSGKLPANGLPGMNPEMIKLMKMQVQMMQQMQKVQQQRQQTNSSGSGDRSRMNAITSTLR